MEFMLAAQLLRALMGFHFPFHESLKYFLYFFAALLSRLRPRHVTSSSTRNICCGFSELEFKFIHRFAFLIPMALNSMNFSEMTSPCMLGGEEFGSG
jgi:hypothetical protein